MQRFPKLKRCQAPPYALPFPRTLPYNLPAMTTETTFANPRYLADPVWLQGHLDAPDVVIVDLDAEAGYLRGHVPGALFLDNNYERNPETGWVDTFPPERFAASCQALGIGDDTLVVAYDNNMSLHAARFWWTLAYYGHRNVRVLDGGWRRWVSEGRPIAFDRAAPQGGAVFTPRVDHSVIATYDQVRAGCAIGGANAADTVIWDTRTTAEYSGRGEPQHPPRPRRRRRPPGLDGPDGAGYPPLQVARGTAAIAVRRRHNAGQGSLRLLTGRAPCGARRICPGPAGLRRRPQLR